MKWRIEKRQGLWRVYYPDGSWAMSTTSFDKAVQKATKTNFNVVLANRVFNVYLAYMRGAGQA